MAVPNGSISFQLNIDATIIANPFGLIPSDQVVVFQFDSTGDIVAPTGQTNAQIYSNAELNPQNADGLGTYYLVTFYDANGARINKSPMNWQFPEAAGSTVDIGMMTPFSTVGGTVIFYPTSFTITPPGPSTLGGVFSNAGSTSNWIRSINTNGSVSLSQPAFSDISGTLSASQLPSPLTFTNVQVTGTFQAETTAEIGVVGTATGQILLDGGTSGQATITAPAVAGTVGNPVLFSNSINIPNGGVFSINTDTGISRGGVAGTLDVGNGTAGNASGTVNAARYNIAGAQIAAANLSNGTTGTGSIVLSASPTFTGTLIAAALTASGLIIAQANLNLGVAGTTGGLLTFEGATSGAATITAPAVAGTITNPLSFSNSIEIPSGTVFQISTDTGISRDSAGVIDIGNGTAGNASGSIKAANITLTGDIITGSAAATVGAGQIAYGSTTAVTATAGAATLPANPVGFIIANVAGVTAKIPYYAA